MKSLDCFQDNLAAQNKAMIVWGRKTLGQVKMKTKIMAHRREKVLNTTYSNVNKLCGVFPFDHETINFCFPISVL